MANRADRMLDTFSTFFGAGQGIRRGIEKRREQRAYKGYQQAKSDLAGIPTGPTQQEMGLADQRGELEPAIPGSPTYQQELDYNQEVQARSATAAEQGQQFRAETRAQYQKRLADAKVAMSEFMTPEELVTFEEAEAQQAIRKFKTNSMMLAHTIEGLKGGDASPEQVAEVANQTMASIPNGISGVASVVGGEAIMSFYNEGTGSMLGAVPLNDADAIRKLSGFVDAPDKYLEYVLDRDKADAIINYNNAQAEYTKNKTDTERFNVVQEFLNDADANLEKAKVNATGYGTLGMTPAQWQTYTDKVQSQVDRNVTDDIKDLPLGALWYRADTGIAFHLWNQNKISNSTKAADIGSQWGDALDAGMQAVANLESGMFKDGPYAEEIAGYYQGKPMSSDVQVMLLTAMTQNGSLQETGPKDNPTYKFVAQDGTAYDLPPAVFGMGTPASAIGVDLRRAQNMAGGEGLFSTINPELRAQAEAFLSHTMSKWTPGGGKQRAVPAPGPAAAPPPPAAAAAPATTPADTPASPAALPPDTTTAAPAAPAPAPAAIPPDTQMGPSTPPGIHGLQGRTPAAVRWWEDFYGGLPTPGQRNPIGR